MGRKALVFVLCACLLTGFVAFEIYANLPLNQIPTQPDDGNPQITTSPTNEPSGNQNVDDNPSGTNSPSNGQTTGDDKTQTQPEVPINTDPTPPEHVNEPDHEAVADYVWNSSEVIDVTLNGNSITVSVPNKATVEGSKVAIKTAGTYRVTGSLTDGQVIVDTVDKETVRLILNSVNIYCSNNPAIYVVNAKKTIIVIQENTQNTIKDGNSYVVGANGEPNAAVFSTGDLTVYGQGTLIVEGNYNDGIASKDGLIIKGGSITVKSVDDAVRGKDYLVIKSGQLSLDAGGDGLKSDNAEDITRGYISVDTGTIQIAAGGDGFDARTDVIIKSGQISLASGGGSSNNVVSGTSAKGIKAIVSLIIDNAVINADSADDAIHSNGTIAINGGSFSLSTGDDGIHADDVLTVNNGEVTISKAYEGLESAVIIINGGNIHVASNDDGVNIAGGKDASGIKPGDTFNSGTYYLAINDGYVFVNIYGDGDGIDANGAIIMTDGKVVVCGSPTLMNTAIDHDGAFNMTGGFILGVGSTGTRIAPAQGPSSTSTQYALLLNFNYSLPAGTLIHLQTGSGAEVFTFSPTRSYKSIAFSSPTLTKGTTYDVYYNGSSTGTLKDGLYTGGTYTPGTKYTSFTITTIITKPPSLPLPFSPF